MFGGLPKVDIPDVNLPDIPAVPGLGGSSIDVKDLQTKLDEAEKAIIEITQGAIPKVDIPFPKLPEDALGPSGRAPYAQLAQSDGVQRVKAKASAKASAKRKAAEAKAKEAAEAKQRAEEELKDQAAQTQAQVTAAAKTAFASMGVVSLISVAIAAGMAAAASASAAAAMYLPYLNAVLSAITQNLGIYKSHKAKFENIFELINSVITKAKDKVTTILDATDDMILAPLNELNDQIDQMEDDQKPALDKAKMLQSTLGVDVPEPGDLRKPLDGAEDMIEGFVDKAKKMVPGFLDEILGKTLPGQLITDKSKYNLYVITLPVASLVLFNILIAVATVYICATSAATPAETRRLSGGFLSANTQDLTILVAHSHSSGEDTHRSKTMTLPAGMDQMVAGLSMDTVMPYMKPTLVQILLSLVQVVLMMIASQGPRIVKLFNGIISDLQKKMNDKVNNDIKEVVDKVFGDAFKSVKEQADDFFPKIKKVFDALSKVPGI